MIVGDVKVFGFNVFSSFGTGDVTVLGKGKGAHIILEDDIGRDRITLSLKEIACPKDVSGFVVETNEFTFSRAFCRDFLFDRRTCCSTLAKSKKTSGMALAIIMGLMQSINIPNDR